MGVMGATARAGGIVAAQPGGLLLPLLFPLALSVYALSLGVAGGAALLLRDDPRGRALRDRV